MDIFLAMEINSLWQMVLADLQTQVSKGVYQTFLAQSHLISLTNDVAVIGCNQALHVTYLEKHYEEQIKKLLEEYTKRHLSLEFTVKSLPGKKTFDGPLFSVKLPQEDTNSSLISRLNPDYTFENFAVSTSNQMAYAAATAVSKSPGNSYNPLFLYGGVGVGKTHLMQAIRHYVLLKKPKAKIIYSTSEEFTNEIIEAIQTKTASAFKKRYRQVDMLLIDDVQFIAGKNTAQEEFFHTFNSIYQSKGQIILTSDRPPENMVKLEDRLRSRFEGGLIIDIGQPDFELRCAIVLIKAKRRAMELPIEIAKLIATNIENPRKLEGMLIRIITESQTRNEPITYDSVSGLLGKAAKEISQPRVSAEKALSVVASYFNIKQSEIKGLRRDSYLAVPRQILYYILRDELKLPFMNIGEFVGNRDHTTVIHGVRKIFRLQSTDEKIRGDIVGIKAKLFG